MEVNLSITSLNVKIDIFYITIVLVAILIYSNYWPIIYYITLILSNNSESTINVDIINDLPAINTATGFIFFSAKTFLLILVLAVNIPTYWFQTTLYTLVKSPT